MLSYAQIAMMRYICIFLFCIRLVYAFFMKMFIKLVLFQLFYWNYNRTKFFSEICKSCKYCCIIQFITNCWITNIQITTRYNMVWTLFFKNIAKHVCVFIHMHYIIHGSFPKTNTVEYEFTTGMPKSIPR